MCMPGNPRTHPHAWDHPRRVSVWEVLVSSNLGAGTSRGICPAGLPAYLPEPEPELACSGGGGASPALSHTAFPALSQGAGCLPSIPVLSDREWFSLKWENSRRANHQTVPKVSFVVLPTQGSDRKKKRERKTNKQTLLFRWLL